MRRFKICFPGDDQARGHTIYRGPPLGDVYDTREDQIGYILCAHNRPARNASLRTRAPCRG